MSLISDDRKFKLFWVGGICHVVSWYDERPVHCQLFSKPVLLLKYRKKENKPFFSCLLFSSFGGVSAVNDQGQRVAVQLEKLTLDGNRRLEAALSFVARRLYRMIREHRPRKVMKVDETSQSIVSPVILARAFICACTLRLFLVTSAVIHLMPHII